MSPRPQANKTTKARTAFFISIPLPLMFTLTSACVHYQSEIDSRLESWKGRHPDELVSSWGAPDTSYTMENGTKVLTYTSDRTTSRAGGYGYTSYRFGNYSYTESCKINFFTDTGAKKIERFTTTGDDYACVDVLRDLPDPK